MKRFVFLLVFCVSPFSVAADPFFLKPLFERLEVEKLRQQVTALTRPNLSPHEKFEQVATVFFLAEGLEWLGRPHEALDRWKGVERFCERELAVSENSSGYPEYLCSLYHAGQSRSGSSWSRFEHSREAIALIERARLKGKVLDADRFYAEGRVFGMLPPGMGRDSKQAILYFQMLDRLAPQSPSVKFHLGENYQALGNSGVANKYYNEARELAPQNPRFKDWTGNLRFISAPYPGMSSEIYPSLFASSASGLGARLYLVDPRLFDTDREGELTLWATLSGQFGAAGGIADVETVDGAALFLRAGVDFGEETFYGLGPDSLYSNATDIEMQREFLEIAAGNVFSDPFYLKIGWSFHWFAAKLNGAGPIATISAPSAAYSYDSGGFGELGIDAEHIQARVRGFFPQEGILSTSTYTRWLGEIGVFGSLVGRWSGKAKAILIHLTETGPFGAYPRLAGDALVPGVRYGRFVDRSLGMVWAEISRPIVSALSMGLFGSCGSVASDAGGLFKSKLLAGGGGSATWGSEARGIRGELGVFANEFSFSLRANAGF